MRSRPRRSLSFEPLERRELMHAGHSDVDPAFDLIPGQLPAWDSPLIPPGGSALDRQREAQASGDLAESPWTTGDKTVLYIRATYSDKPTQDPQSAASIESMMVTVNQFFVENSFGQTTLGKTDLAAGIDNLEVTGLIVLPQTEQFYITNGDGRLRSDALAAARAAGGAAGRDWNYLNYHFDAVRFTGGPGSYGGQAFVGARGMWMKSSSAGVAAHEFGHNYGLWHANYWSLNDPETIIGPGVNQEYGDIFDTMGSASAGMRHFSDYEKNLLDWIPAANVHTVSAAGTYRLHAHDLGGTVDPSRMYSIKIAKDPSGAANNARDYRLDYRQHSGWSGNRWITNGIGVRWDRWSQTSGSHLLDMTPNSADGKNDASLVVGRTFSDEVSDIHITPVARGGSGLDRWIDVSVNFGDSGPDQAPYAGMSAGATSVGTGVTVNFASTAFDPDGDELAYSWDFGDKTFGTNSPAASKSWATAGSYRVRLTVSDMKGKSYSVSTIITVGNPATSQVSGRVLDVDGNPVADVRVHNGLAITHANYRYAYTDSDGTYALTNVPAGTYTIGAAKAGWNFPQQNFTNPVAVGTNPNGIDFTAAPVLYKITGKVTSDGTTPVPGALVSNGISTEPTDAAGNYTLFAPLGNYTLTTSNPGLIFPSTTAIVQYADATMNIRPAVFTVSGSISGVTAGTAITVTDGVRATTVTASGGSVNYSLTNVPAGSWNITASAAGISFSRGGTWTNPLNVNASRGGINFVRDATTVYSIRGRVTRFGQGMAGVTVTADDGAGGLVTSITDGGGGYALVGQPNGTYTVIPTRDGYTFSPGSTDVTIDGANVTGRNFATLDAAPTVASPATAGPGAGLVRDLSVLGDDDSGEPFLTYTWSVVDAPAGGTVTFGPNGTNSAKNTRAVFNMIGSFTLRATIKDAANNSVTSDVRVGGVNAPPVLESIPDATIPSTQDILTVPLSATDPDGDPLTYSVTAQSLAYVLDQQLGLSTDGNLYENHGGRGERWVQGDRGLWYFILPDGDLYLWDGGDGADGALVATPGASYHARPELLYDAQPDQPRVEMSVSGSTLTIDREDGFTGSVVVTATVSDGQSSDTRTFIVTVTSA